jgi:hypothetical protein
MNPAARVQYVLAFETVEISDSFYRPPKTGVPPFA